MNPNCVYEICRRISLVRPGTPGPAALRKLKHLDHALTAARERASAEDRGLLQNARFDVGTIPAFRNKSGT